MAEYLANLTIWISNRCNNLPPTSFQSETSPQMRRVILVTLNNEDLIVCILYDLLPFEVNKNLKE